MKKGFTTGSCAAAAAKAAAFMLLIYSAVKRERSQSQKEIERLSEISARTERENLCLKYAHTPHLPDADYDFLKRAMTPSWRICPTRTSRSRRSRTSWD